MLLFTTIYIVASTLLFTLIYQKKLSNLKNTQADNISQNMTYFTATFTNQSNNKIKK